MFQTRPIFLAILLLLIYALANQLLSSTLTTDEATNWIRYTVPLPKSIKLFAKVTVRSNKVQVVCNAPVDIVTQQAVQELKQVLGSPENVSEPEFTITLELGGPDSKQLENLKNSDQAYRIITPDEKNIRLIALSSRGLYYATKTLQQLISAKKTETQVTMPILEVLDWPDMQKRGLWGTDNFAHLKWLADRKMNLMEQISALGVDKDGKLFAKLKDGREPLITEGPRYGIEFSPVILHLEQSSGHIMEVYPQVKGKGSTHHGVMCYSQPEVVEALAEWMVQLASMPHVTSIDTWMTENLGSAVGCQCENCKATGKPWPVLEARAIVNAWHKAQERLGQKFILRVMTAESTEFCNFQVFRELPPEVELAYYHSLLTYNTFRRPMLRKYIAEEAARGRWVGVVPNLSPTVGFCEPFTGADFIHYRISEFVTKGLSGLLGYATPRVHYYRFNVEAAAEWSWNLRGRTPREFAYSYAVRQGWKDPEKFAEWSEVMGPVGWDVFGSGFPNEELRKSIRTVARRLEKVELPPLGFILWDAYPSPWGNIPDEQQLENDVKAAAEGVKLAKELGIPSIIYESLLIDGYIRAIKALYELKQIVRPEGVPAIRRDLANYWFRQYIAGLRQAREALPRWEDTVMLSKTDPRFTDKPVEVIDNMIKEMTDVAKHLGFYKP
ncbi:MAG: glycoside hydrolase family 20 zincin-like fold domain-containing protein [Armatimonadota bacterium]